MTVEAENPDIAASAAARAKSRARRTAGPRPQYRNIHVNQIRQYSLPAPGMVSILHRISGAGLFLVGIPFILYLLQESLTSSVSFERFQSVAGSFLGKLVLIGLAWAFIHHLFAGLRYLVLDLHIGTEKDQAKKSANIVLIASIVVWVLSALCILGA